MITNNIKVRLTAMSGVTKDLSFDTKEHVESFVAQLPNDLGVNQRVKVTCDILGIDGYLQGKKTLAQLIQEGVLVCSLIMLSLFFKIMYHASKKNIQILVK